MKKVKILWMPVLLGALLMATLVGVAGAGPNARPEASPALVDYMFSASHCTPAATTINWGYTVFGQLTCTGGGCIFLCPIKPPHEGLIRVQRLAMYAFDNDGNPPPSSVCVVLAQQYPKTGTTVTRLTIQCTADSVADPQACAYNPANFKVSVLQDIYALVSMPSSGQKLHGFKLKYEPL